MTKFRMTFKADLLVNQENVRTHFMQKFVYAVSRGVNI